MFSPDNPADAVEAVSPLTSPSPITSLAGRPGHFISGSGVFYPLTSSSSSTSKAATPREVQGADTSNHSERVPLPSPRHAPASAVDAEAATRTSPAAARTVSANSSASAPSTAQSKTVAASPRRGPSLSFSIPIAAPVAVPVPFIATPPSYPEPPPPEAAPPVPPPPAVPPRPSLIHSPAYTEFKANVPQTRLPLTSSISWSYYAMGSTSLPPLIFLHGSSTTASSFYSQMLALSARGYRVISASWPPYWTVKQWVDGFKSFLDGLHIDEAHLFGFGLGGLLALQFAVDWPERVSSLLLCNSFAETTPFVATTVWTSALYWLPEFAVKSLMLQAFPASTLYPEAIDFVVEEMATLTAGDVASRLTLIHSPHSVDLHVIDQSRVTLIFPTEDIHFLPDSLRDSLLSAMPNSKVAWLKEGGDFPHIAAADQVTLHAVLHLRRMDCPSRSVVDEGKANAAVEGVKEPAPASSPSPSSLLGSGSSGPRPPHFSAPLFKPARSAIEGGPAVISAYDAMEVAEEEEGGKARGDRVDAGNGEEEGKGMREVEVDHAEERRRQESLRLQAEVEVRLSSERALREAERAQAQRRAQERSEAVMGGLLDGQPTPPPPTRVFD